MVVPSVLAAWMAPDERLHDEDLRNLSVELDPTTGEATRLEHGSDYNERLAETAANRGLITARQPGAPAVAWGGDRLVER